MKTRLLAFALTALGLGLAVVSAPVSAGITFYSPITAFEDDDLDMHIDNDGDGLLSVGDRIVSVIEFNNSQGINAGQGPNPILPDELTGVIDITVTSKVLVGAGVFDFNFGPTTLGLLTGGVGSVANIADAMAVLWLDSTPDLNVINAACGTLATCLPLASDGLPNPYVAVGISAADTDTYWRADDALDNPAVVAGLPASTKVGAFNFNLELLVNNSGVLVLPQLCVPLDPACGTGDGLVDLIGSGDLLGGQGGPATNGWFARSDTDAQIAVPEPGSLALLGLSLAIAGATAMRRRRKIS